MDKEEEFRNSIADAVNNGLNSRRRQTRITADDVIIVRESLREVNGTLEVAFFVRSAGGVVSGDRLANVVRQQEEQISQSVSTFHRCNFYLFVVHVASNQMYVFVFLDMSESIHLVLYM